MPASDPSPSTSTDLPDASALPPSPVGRGRSARRSDIQGLRAICMIQVLIFHAWKVGSPIGVDAFIMISAFLMTASFVRRSESGHMPRFLERWTSTFKRLIPPLAVVVSLTVWASIRLLPASRAPEVVAQGFASLFYVQNWRLMRVSADYFADDHALASPLQHLWSMSMQGQVFLLWPVLMTICVLVARVIRKPVRPVAFGAFLILAVASLAWLELGTHEKVGLYFDTRARLWEFALGSALACAHPWFNGVRNAASGTYARVLGWMGLAVLLVFSVVSMGSYPGPMATAPMLAASAILLLPSGGHRLGASRLLSLRPLVALGDVSYAVYLVHWPVFVLYLNATDHESLGIGDGLVLMGVSIVLAIGLTRLIEDPVKNWRGLNASVGRQTIGAVAALALGVVPLIASQRGLTNTGIADDSGEQHPGAAVLVNPPQSGFTEPALPLPADLFPAKWASPLPDPCDEGYPPEFDGEDAYCSQYGNEITASGRVLAIGSSHVSHMMPQVLALAQARNWYVQASHMGFCVWGISDAYGGECAARNEAAFRYVDSFHPDVVILQSTVTAPDSPDETVVDGLDTLTRELTDRGVVVIGVRDTPRSGTNLLNCAVQNPTTGPIGGCLMNRREHQAEVDPASELETIPGFVRIDMTDQYCTSDICPSVIGNINVYVDMGHLTPQYQRTVAPAFVERVSAGLENLELLGWPGSLSDEVDSLMPGVENANGQSVP